MEAIKKHQILVVDDEPSVLDAIDNYFSPRGFEVDKAPGGEEAINLVKKAPYKYSVIILDFNMPNGFNGAETAERLYQLNPDLIILIFTVKEKDPQSLKSMLGACPVHILSKSISLEILYEYVRNYCVKFDEEIRSAELGSSAHEYEKTINSIGQVGRSKKLSDVAILAMKYAPGESTVLVQGEPGVGKEKVAQAIHELSGRGKKPIVAINCAAISPHLLDSEMFGHIKGSFTGAFQNATGKFEQADGGSLFLDEIGEMSSELQSKLLRAIQEKVFTPVGGKDLIKVDVKIICATNANLKKAVADGKFRQDLYYRIQGLTISIPPLRERVEDIEPLIAFFSQGTGKRFLMKTVRKMERYSWPGNVRELQSEVDRLVRITADDKIMPINLDNKYFDPQTVVTLQEEETGFPTWDEFEKRQEIDKIKYIEQALKKCNGVLRKASDEYFKHPNTTVDRIRKKLPILGQQKG